MTHLPGPKYGAHATTEIDIFNLLFDEKIIRKIRENFSRERDVRPTDAIEIRAPVGLSNWFLQCSRKNVGKPSYRIEYVDTLPRGIRRRAKLLIDT